MKNEMPCLRKQISLTLSWMPKESQCSPRPKESQTRFGPCKTLAALELDFWCYDCAKMKDVVPG